MISNSNKQTSCGQSEETSRASAYEPLFSVCTGFHKWSRNAKSSSFRLLRLALQSSSLPILCAWLQPKGMQPKRWVFYTQRRSVAKVVTIGHTIKHNLSKDKHTHTHTNKHKLRLCVTASNSLNTVRAEWNISEALCMSLPHRIGIIYVSFTFYH